MGESNTNIWAPWRMEYVRSLSDEASDIGCFLCHYAKNPDDDRDQLVVWRGQHVYMLMNRFPYTNGHLLVAPYEHCGDPMSFSRELTLELNDTIWKSVELLKRTVHCEGFNVGFNLGHCAGAGLPDHIHAHIVPRWEGDTNYMAVLGDVRVMPDSLTAQYDDLIRNAVEMGLRDGDGS